MRHIATFTGKPYAYYRTSGNSDLTQVAARIAEDMYEKWWADDRFAESRDLFSDVVGCESPFKVEVSRHVASAMANLPTAGAMYDEVMLLKNSVVNGVITTNYDPLLEELFKDFQTYVGQNELLFSHPKGIGEIYKIHGSCTVPESIVITQSDFEVYRDRNPYLAAKLLTIFVEHPIVFLGYSLGDKNVQDILLSIARVLTHHNLEQLQNHLIFVEWNPDLTEPAFQRTFMQVGEFTIPVVSLKVPDFIDIFRTLGTLRRKFPARLLRQLKEHIYDLVEKNDPDDRLFVQDIDDETKAKDIDVVFGVGVRLKLSEHGYVGLTREDLLLDVLKPVSSYDPIRVVQYSLPHALRNSPNTPIYRYLREAGMLNSDGSVKGELSLDQRIRSRVTQGSDPLRTSKSSRRRAERMVHDAGGVFAGFMHSGSFTLAQILECASMIPAEKLILEELRQFLERNCTAFHGPSSQPSLWAKLVCYYDFLAFGPEGAAR